MSNDVNNGSTIDNERLFESFVLSVIKQKCKKQGKPFYTEYDASKLQKNLTWLGDKGMRNSFRFDGYAPEGFDDFQQPVIVEVKFNPRNMSYIPLCYDFEIITLYVISSNASQKVENTKYKNVIVWDRRKIQTWEEDYPIDYYAYYGEKDNLTEKIELKDFVQKSDTNFDFLLDQIDKGNISIALGSGVSLDFGSPNWNQLIQNLYDEIQLQGMIDSIENVEEKIGGSNVIDGQFAKDNLNKAFLPQLYAQLYTGYRAPINNYYNNSSIYHIAKIALKMAGAKNFNIVTYNYDDFLEQMLHAIGIDCLSVYSEEIQIDKRVSVFHPHGFLPYGTNANQLDQYNDTIVFSESDYHRLYNNPYHWAMVSQLYLYRGCPFMFVGCSLSDPNLRRILELTYIKGKNHYAFMLKDSLSIKDQFIVHKHFLRLGVECIWVNSPVDLQNKLKILSQ